MRPIGRAKNLTYGRSHLDRWFFYILAVVFYILTIFLYIGRISKVVSRILCK